MPHSIHRRRFLTSAAATAACLPLAKESRAIGSVMGQQTASQSKAAEAKDTPAGTSKFAVTGQPEGAAAGNSILSRGGNAVDAIVAAALVSGVVAVPMTGIGGYGGSAVVGGLVDGKVRAYDFNTTAPSSLSENFYRASETGEVEGNVNTFGWKSVGVPGILAGLQKILDAHGTMKFSEVAQPAIRFAIDGFVVNAALATAIKAHQRRLKSDSACLELLFSGGEPLQQGQRLRNLDLGRMLEALASDGNVSAFYQGRIGEQIAEAIQQHGGLVTAADMAAYEVGVVEPLSIAWGAHRLYTVPPTAGGLSVFQTLMTLQTLGWPSRVDSRELELVEALRIAWDDRLKLLGDPKFVDVPISKLLSSEYAEQSSARVRKSIASGVPVEAHSDGRSAGGTIHLNAVDANGMAVALTLTHGGGFGAQVAVPGFGLILGHGLSRFDPRAGRANSPGPKKRPLHNMCPTLLVASDKSVTALGAVGGRRIVSGVASILAHRLGEGTDLAVSIKAPRVHTEGDLNLVADDDFPSQDSLTQRGYAITKGGISSANAIQRNGDGTIVRGAR